MLRQTLARRAVSARLLSNTTVLRFREGHNILDKEDVSSPQELAKESHLPQSEFKVDGKIRQPKLKNPMLSDNVIENDPSFKMVGWKQSLGQWIVRTFNIDMDRSRAGPVAGSYYFGECKKQALVYPNEPLSDTAKFYYETLGLPRTFAQWFQITALHYWILSVRMRALPGKYGKNYQQKLVDRIFRDMELRMSGELGIASNRIIERYLKDFHQQLIGSIASYDEGLMTDDITFAGAIWRNIFGGKPDADVRHIEALVGYVRSQLYVLNQITDREFGFGKFRFVPPDQVVKPLTSYQIKKMREAAQAEFATMTLPSQRSLFSLEE